MQAQMTPNDALQLAIREFTTQTALAKALGVRTGHIFYWLGAKVPVEHAISIFKLTGGRVRYEDLRPDIDWEVLQVSARGDKQQ